MKRIRTGYEWPVPPPLDRILDRLWRITIQWGITVEGTLTWWCSDDDHQRERALDHELRVPRVLWRPYCWIRGRHDEYDGRCIFCEKLMSSPVPSVDEVAANAAQRLPYSYETVREVLELGRSGGVRDRLVVQVLAQIGPDRTREMLTLLSKTKSLR